MGLTSDEVRTFGRVGIQILSSGPTIILNNLCIMGIAFRS
jgi:hypothetical protein